MAKVSKVPILTMFKVSYVVARVSKVPILTMFRVSYVVARVSKVPILTVLINCGYLFYSGDPHGKLN